MNFLNTIKALFIKQPVKKTHHIASNSEVYQQLEKHKISVARLRVGMTVIELDRPWTDVPVMFQELTIRNEKDIQLLKKYCQHVFVDYLSYKKVNQASIASFRKKTRYKNPVFSPQQASKSLRDEMPRAKSTFDRSNEHISRLMKAVEKDSQIDIESSKKLVASCVKSILNNPNAMFWLTKIKNKDAYTAEHCMRVGILAIAFGKHLQLPQQDLEMVGLCGMLHDVGKMKVPQHILNKEGALTPDEFKIVKEHTVLGYVFLKNHGGIDEEVCTAAYNHHERLNGNGYPRQITPENIGLFDRLIAIVDSYDAMTSDRCYRKGMPPSQALSILYKEQDCHYDAELVKEFIQMVGIYPVGSLVQMNNGQIGIVLGVNPDHKLEPVIELLTDPEKNVIKPVSIDLSKQHKLDHEQTLRISKTLADSEVDFDLEHFIYSAA